MASQRRLNPKNDFLFKRLFGDDDSKALLIGLLNAIFQNKGQDLITDVTVMENVELTRQLLDDKEGRLDVRCETNERVQINVEMQVQRYRHMEKRSLFYLGKMFVGSIRAGEHFAEIKKTIAINLLDHRYLPLEGYHHCFHLYEDECKSFRLTDLIEIHFIECPKVEKMTFNIHNPLHRWLRFLDDGVTEEQLKELIEMDPLIRTAEERLAFLSGDEQMLRLYEAREEALIERNSLISEAREEGLEIGMAEGREIGREEGREEGRQEGRQEGSRERAIEIAKNLMALNINMEQIVKATNLTVDEIEALR